MNIANLEKTLKDANSMTLNHQSLGKTYWVSGAPVSGQSASGTIVFYNYAAPVVLDQIVFAAGLADQPPVMNNVYFSNGKFIFSGTNGFAGVGYYVLSSTNLALPSANWTRETTNNFDNANGFFSITNTVTPAAQKFYRLQLQ
ncbi:MAG: hypothetical protein ACREFE_20480 [Limisphaerales bacterium]